MGNDGGRMRDGALRERERAKTKGHLIGCVDTAEIS